MPLSIRALSRGAAAASLCALTACSQPAPPPPAIDLLITNARIIDGTGAPAREGGVAVSGGRITDVFDAAAATAAASRATRVIDAKGRVVAPGFIDMHSHSDMPLVTDGNAQSKIRQGVTTEVIGESGSIAPQASASATQPWTDFAGYFGLLEKQGIAVNLLSYVGLGTAREMIIGNDNRPPTTDELKKMQDLVTASMQQGAAGVSTGLIYPPNAFATLDELVALSQPAAALGGRYASHLRHDGKKLRDGIGEAIAIGERAKLPVHVFHIKVTGQANFGRMKEVVELVEAARGRGVKVTADIYPYIASSTSLTATLPQWVMDGGADKMVERLSDRATRARVRRDMEDPNAEWDNRYQSAGTWANVQLAAIGRARGVATTDESPSRRYEGMRVADAAKAAGKDPFDFVFDLLVATRGSVACVYFIMSEDDVKLAMTQPWVAIGSDGSALSIEGPLRSGVPHPRNFGTFPRVLGKYVREEKVIPLEEAIRKMTSLAADTLQLPDRGTIAAGKWADLVIFDPAEVRDTATFENPFSYPQGIDTVIVNGAVVLDEGTHTGTKPGKVLRHTSAQPAR
ncbi:MAG: D-aminoacylase [Acidobacteria bacterium]|nr:D-aminoacylase [Acidobacteriota bacterium]